MIHTCLNESLGGARVRVRVRGVRVSSEMEIEWNTEVFLEYVVFLQDM